MTAPDIILKLSNIESYYGPIMAIRGISLEVPRGKIVTLLGANGAGKTTVLKTISGILDPQKGSIEFCGKPIQRMEADKIVRLGLSHVPEGREVFPFLSVRENLMMGAYPRKDRDAVADDLERVYAQPSAATAPIGTIHQDSRVPAYLLMDDLLGKHFSIVGTTGSGK